MREYPKNTHDKIESLLARYDICPVENKPREWAIAFRAQCWRTAKSLLKKTALRLVGRQGGNDQKEILRAYDAQWKKKLFARYAPKPAVGGAPWVWVKKKWLMSNEAGAAVRLVYLDEIIERTRPRTVLEVGCGNGINLLMLSARHPEIQFFGLEPTQGGVDAVRSVIADACLPAALIQFAPFEIMDPRAPSRVQVERGDARALPFPDKKFDLVITSLALEQMEEIRGQALREIVRVSSKWVSMLEPFREVNASGWRRLYVTTYDYFQGYIADLPAYGLEIQEKVFDMPHKAVLGTALVLTQRTA